MKPEYSIITICKNAKKDLLKTVESVMYQKIDMSTIEMVIVDGASTDGTAEAMKEYIEKAEKLGLLIRFYSESDKGIYDAMNKGAALATGEWCLYLNAGDIFFDEYSMLVFERADKNNADIIYGDVVFKYQNKYRVYRSKDPSKLSFLGEMEFCHQSVITRSKYLKNNPFSLQEGLAADFGFFVKAFSGGVQYQSISQIVSIFDCDGIGTNNGVLVALEDNKILYKYNLISKKKYETTKESLGKLYHIRSCFPKFVVRIRHKIVMKKHTADWKSLDEVREIVSKEENRAEGNCD